MIITYLQGIITHRMRIFFRCSLRYGIQLCFQPLACTKIDEEPKKVANNILKHDFIQTFYKIYCLV